MMTDEELEEFRRWWKKGTDDEIAMLKRLIDMGLPPESIDLDDADR